ncbi:hypothetical protein A2276_02820 [candidate division WOR-1 bacterium RIFOXYA12_FULL_43_27]|uniref:Uncharacterized protein n=1 Tax=candidate division WOR-1 bacterium RIFOXYC2_FULL_46_14 TaxID=1802587 RepID=A0A1F4U7T7_UNCSA|nr:MAG: hypothetical protein A2276_02820 [candidate division WOR-1 bacterium RIFOXYA12_FULL_43_27]OGC19359.1 MAG: hypothetical protein A2292_01515 [candidate division WOR-1 bacterium RIFOXYB2_FULL_46_45]OGC30348.1 MAG: hypothetical protein A2232_01515 [candidate division WOR-1 bacterium RIFOXYA2_FULL_46_56]OGC40949.1 MAG: hypothetical protein A2438_01515 [candidate division WOR-1 bacterium RIFOXYC2_FULL_46_14]
MEKPLSNKGAVLTQRIDRQINDFETKLAKVDPSGLGSLEAYSTSLPVTKAVYTKREFLSDLYSLRARLYQLQKEANDGNNAGAIELELQQISSKTDYLLNKWELLGEANKILASLKSLPTQSRQIVASDQKARQAYNTARQLGSYLWGRSDSEMQKFFHAADYFQRRLFMLSVKKEYESGYNYILRSVVDYNPKLTPPPSPYQKNHHDPAIQEAYRLVIQLGEKPKINLSQREEFQKSAVILGRLLAYAAFRSGMDKHFPGINQYLGASPALRMDMDRIRDLAFMRPRRIFARTERVKWLQDFRSQVENFTKKAWACKANKQAQEKLKTAAEDHKTTYSGLVSNSTAASIRDLAQGINSDTKRTTDFNLDAFDPRPTDELQGKLEDVLAQVRKDIESTDRVNLLITNTMVLILASLAGGALGGTATEVIAGRIGNSTLAKVATQAVDMTIQGVVASAVQRSFSSAVGIEIKTDFAKELLWNSLAGLSIPAGNLIWSTPQRTAHLTLGQAARFTAAKFILPTAANIGADILTNEIPDPTLMSFSSLAAAFLTK